MIYHGFPDGAKVKTVISPGNAGIGALAVVDGTQCSGKWSDGHGPYIPVKWLHDYHQNDGLYLPSAFVLTVGLICAYCENIFESNIDYLCQSCRGKEEP